MRTYVPKKKGKKDWTHNPILPTLLLPLLLLLPTLVLCAEDSCSCRIPSLSSSSFFFFCCCFLFFRVQSFFFSFFQLSWWQMMTDCKMGFTMDPPKLQRILLASAVVCLIKDVPESEYISSSSSMLAAMRPINVPWILSPTVSSSSVTAISWHALIFLLIKSFMPVSLSLSAWKSFLKFLLAAEWRFLKLVLFSFVFFSVVPKEPLLYINNII